MSVKTNLYDTSNRASAAISPDGEQLINFGQAPALNGVNKIKPFVGLISRDGDGTTTNLNLNGATTNIDAFIGSSMDGDLYLTTANIVISDNAAVALNKFGGLSALANGVNFFYGTAEERIEIATGIKTNFDFIRIGTLTNPIGGKTDAYQLANIDPSNNDGYNPVLDLTRVSPIGIRLKKNSNDRLGIQIRDNLTGLATFNILMIGFVRLG